MNPRKSVTQGLGGILGCLVGAILLLLIGCGGGGSTTEPDVFVPDLANGWVDSGNPNHLFFFNGISAPGPNASFRGEELTDSSAVSNLLTGSYSGRAISFTIQRSAGNVTFQGRFPDKDTMVLSSATAGNLTLVRKTS